MKGLVFLIALVMVACRDGSENGTVQVLKPESARQQRTDGTPRAALADTVYEIGGDVLPPKRLSSCDPVIPDGIKGRRITQPIFTYEIVVSADGRVTSVVLKSASQTGDPYDALERAFREAIRDCRFEPATRLGSPVAVRMLMVTRTEVR